MSGYLFVQCTRDTENRYILCTIWLYISCFWDKIKMKADWREINKMKKILHNIKSSQEHTSNVNKMFCVSSCICIASGGVFTLLNEIKNYESNYIVSLKNREHSTSIVIYSLYAHRARRQYRDGKNSFFFLHSFSFPFFFFIFK